MRMWTVLTGLVLGAAALLFVPPAAAWADAPNSGDRSSIAEEAYAPLAALPGTPLETRDYEQREARSPEVQDFKGGDVVVGVGVVTLLLIVLIVYLLVRE